MLDTLVEILLEIIVNGALDASDSKKVAMPVRILLAAGVVLFFGAVVGILIWNGIARGKPAADHLRRSLFGTGHPAGREQNHPFSKGPQAVIFCPVHRKHCRTGYVTAIWRTIWKTPKTSSFLTSTGRWSSAAQRNISPNRRLTHPFCPRKGKPVLSLHRAKCGGNLPFHTGSRV